MGCRSHAHIVYTHPQIQACECVSYLKVKARRGARSCRSRCTTKSGTSARVLTCQHARLLHSPSHTALVLGPIHAYTPPSPLPLFHCPRFLSVSLNAEPKERSASTAHETVNGDQSHGARSSTIQRQHPNLVPGDLSSLASLSGSCRPAPAVRGTYKGTCSDGSSSPRGNGVRLNLEQRNFGVLAFCRASRGV